MTKLTKYVLFGGAALLAYAYWANKNGKVAPFNLQSIFSPLNSANAAGLPAELTYQPWNAPAGADVLAPTPGTSPPPVGYGVLLSPAPIGATTRTQQVVGANDTYNQLYGTDGVFADPSGLA